MSRFTRAICTVLLTCLSLIFIAKLSAQNHRLDSLARVLSTDISDSLSFQIYSEVIWANHRDSSDYAIALANDLMARADKSENERNIRIAHYYYGVIYKNTGDWNLAIKHLDTVYRKSEEMLDTSLMSNTAYQLGIVSNRSGNYKEAIEYFNKNIELNTIMDRPGSVATTWNSKASVYRTLKLYDLAFAHYKKALDYYQSKSDSVGMANVYNNLGNTYSEVDSFNLAFQNYNEQESINLARNNTWGMGYVYENRGRLFEKMGKYTEAISSLEKSLIIRRKMGHQSVLASTLITLGSSELKLEKFGRSLVHTKEGVDIAQKYNMPEQLIEGYAMMSKANANLGKFTNAYQFQLLSTNLRDSLLNEKITDQALRIDALSDLENVQKEQKIELLSTENELKDLRLASQQRNLIYAILGILGLLALATFIYYSRQRVRNLNSELVGQKSIISKSLKEKEFLLKEIHHRVKNNLQVISSLLKLQAKSVKDPKAQEALDGGRTRVRSMALIHQNLYQDDSNPGGINVQDYISELSSELSETYKMDADRIKINLDIQHLLLDVDTAVPIGLIVNELISNSLKYAFPDNREGVIEMSLKQKSDELLDLTYSDNGIGYNIEEVPKRSFGLRLIRSFAERLNAELRISGKEGAYAYFGIKDFKLAE